MNINDNSKTSRGRLLIHKKLLPILIEETPEEGKILFIGTDISWDYKAAFFNPMKLFDFKTLDIAEGLKPDYVCNIENCPTIPDNEFDLVLFIGMYEFMSEPKNAFKEIYRIIKPKGIALLSLAGIGYGGGGHGLKSIEQALEETKPLTIREVHLCNENDGQISSYHLIALKN